MGGYLEKRIIENKVLAEAEKGCAATNYCHLMIFQQQDEYDKPAFPMHYCPEISSFKPSSKKSFTGVDPTLNHTIYDHCSANCFRMSGYRLDFGIK